MISNRILEFAKSQGITCYKLTKQLGLSTSFFDRERDSVSGAVLQHLVELYPTIDLKWLITGVDETQTLKNEIINLQQQIIRLQTHLYEKG